MFRTSLSTNKPEEDLAHITDKLFEITLDEKKDNTGVPFEKTIEQFDQILPSEKRESIFCCQQTFFYPKETITDHEDLFKSFMNFIKYNQPSELITDNQRGLQFIKQKNFGPIIERRYFSSPDFAEISKDDFIKQGYKRLNSYKNLKCDKHNFYFEVNAYSKDAAVSTHHKSTVNGSTYSRDASQIDLTPGKDKGIWHRKNKKT